MMVEVLEADFVARAVEMDQQATRGVEAPPEGGTWLDKVAREAIITQYLEGAGGRGGRRRVVSAILADGGEKAVREFGECWKDETKERKAKEQIGLWETRKINLDENEWWGDYAINDDEDDVVQDEKQEITGKVEAQQDFGGIESIKLRQRLLVLVSGHRLTHQVRITTPLTSSTSSLMWPTDYDNNSHISRIYLTCTLSSSVHCHCQYSVTFSPRRQCRWYSRLASLQTYCCRFLQLRRGKHRSLKLHRRT
jgi:hypothetical protein